MSLSGIMNVSISGLMSSQEALRTTSNNITNVNTEGYVRKIAELRTRVLASSAGGVEVGAIRRNVDQFLEREALDASGQTNRFEAQAKIAESLQQAIGTVDSGNTFFQRLNDIFTGIADLEIDPASQVRRYALVDDLR
ncbi:MAG: hypothetical protein FJX47_06585, partial [Alphaproteobacteria bacterium]|nr:hypothetical protein [Alphaproteobacteria bacterium]